MAIFNVSSYITSAGLAAVTSAGQIGPYFAVKYFVPFYDPRLDASISQGHGTNTSALNISALNLVSATSDTLQGEKIYASMVNGYSLSNQSFFYQQAGMNTLTNGSTGVLQTKQEIQSNVNLLNGVPLSQCVSATTTTPTTAVGNFTLTNVSNIAPTTYNPLSAQPYPTSAFFRVQSYSPKALGATSACGSYKCRIPAVGGSFKFNGLALYVAKVDQYNYDTANSKPILFAVVLFDKPREKSNLVGGVNSYSFDIDLGFNWSTVGTSGNTPVYVETNYWTKVPTSSNTSAYALNYDGDVVISSSASPGSWMPQAKMTITDPSKAQMRLCYNNNDSFGDRYTEFRTLRKDNKGLISSIKANDKAVLAIDTSCPSDSLLELGTSARATSVKSVAIGVGVSAMGFYFDGYGEYDTTENNLGHNYVFGNGSISVGSFNSSFGHQTSAIGNFNTVIGERSFAGYEDYSTILDKDRGNNLAIGFEVSAITNTLGNQPYSSYFGSLGTKYGYNISIGKRNIATNGFALAIGESTSAIGSYATSIGYLNNSSEDFSTTIGYKLSATSMFSYLIGSNNYSNSIYSFIGGDNNRVTGSDACNFTYGKDLSGVANGGFNLLFGYKNNIDGGFIFTQGVENITKEKYSMTFGYQSSAIAIGAYAHGFKNYVNSSWSVAFGNINKVIDGADSFSVGNNNTSKGSNTASLGYGNYAAYDSLAFGTSNNAITYSTAIGNNNNSSAIKSYTFGTSNSAAFDNSMGIGFGAKTTKTNQVVIGGLDTDNVTIKAGAIVLDGDVEHNPYYEMNIYRTIVDEGGNFEKIKIIIAKKTQTTSTQTILEVTSDSFINASVWSVVPNSKIEVNSLTDGQLYIYYNTSTTNIIVSSKDNLDVGLMIFNRKFSYGTGKYYSDIEPLPNLQVLNYDVNTTVPKLLVNLLTSFNKTNRILQTTPYIRNYYWDYGRSRLDHYGAVSSFTFYSYNGSTRLTDYVDNDNYVLTNHNYIFKYLYTSNNTLRI